MLGISFDPINVTAMLLWEGSWVMDQFCRECVVCFQIVMTKSSHKYTANVVNWGDRTHSDISYGQFVSLEILRNA